MKISQQDFDLWRDSPVTEAVFDFLRQNAEVAKQNWLLASWEGGNNSPELLADLRARAAALRQVTELEFENISREEDE